MGSVSEYEAEQVPRRTDRRILQAPVEVAGQAHLTAVGLRELGVRAASFGVANRFGYESDLAPWSNDRVARQVEMLFRVPGLAHRYDVFHFHYGRSFFASPLGPADALLLRAIGKTVTVEFWGSDVRLPTVERERNPYFVNSHGLTDERSRRRMDRWASITDGHVIVPDHSFVAYVREHFSTIHISRQRVNTRVVTPAYPSPNVGVPRVMHAPTHRAGKGTPAIRAALEKLRRSGFQFEYEEVHGLPHDVALERYRSSDLVIDQVLAGSHGVFAVEAMSMGKPVVCHILPELEGTFPSGFPIISANPETLEAVLRHWLSEPEERHWKGRESRAYAERVHDCRVVANRLLQIYASIEAG